MQRWTILWLGLAGVAGAQTLDEIDVAESMKQIRAKVNHDLNRLPNYTCTETIERSVQEPPSKHFVLQDLIRLEVALVDRAEIFAWPGSREFQSSHLRDLVPGGAIGNGSFALHAKSVFDGRAAAIERAGETKLGDRRVMEYRYTVPRKLSRFALRHGDREANIGYGGSFYIDQENGSLVRLIVRANDIPQELSIPAEQEILDYQQVRLGEDDFLLPKSSEMRMTSADGSVSLNKTAFTACRQYSTESTLIFTDPTETPGAGPVPNEIRDVPVGLKMEVRLLTPLVWAKSAVGDPLTAQVRRDVKVDKRVVIPKGSQLKGRLICLERRANPSGGSAYLVGVRFEELLASRWRGAVKTQLVEALPMPELMPMRRGPMPRNAPTPVITGAHPSGQNLFVVYNEPRFTDGLDLVLGTIGVGEPSSESQKK
ncbi:MAG: hypothetical protein K2X03_12795 [Bryobacteraceae bacterium]|nr:hypothetical protein [Bryobacteraceae bacterium]